MKIFAGLSASLCAAMLLCGQASAQSPTGTLAGGSQDFQNHMGRGTMTQEQFNKLGEYVDQAKRLTKKAEEEGKTVEELLAEQKARAAELVKALPLACEIGDALLVAEGPEKIDGKEVNTHTYEVACNNGLGYFVVDIDGGKPYGFSCLTAEATRRIDIAAGRKPGTTCALGANLNPEAMTTAALAKVGIVCSVEKFAALGQNTVSHIEYNEVACSNAKGYILVTALPGSLITPQVLTCHDAAMKGLPCKLTDSGAVLSPQTFVDALKAQKVACTADAEKLRVIGQENKLKRYVVEFVCPEKPEGLVAYIPLKDSTAKFETKTCKDAAKAGAACKLNR